ncbi:MAG: hypothetical protein MZV70_59840 [Desulfobacterales bacterium]|nr:hypothetical protein [Desulfobacterales bacterium]
MGNSIPDSSLLRRGVAALDPDRGIFYVPVPRFSDPGNFRLFAFDTRTGAVISSPALSTSSILKRRHVLALQSVVGVPTANEWGMIIFTILAGMGSVHFLKKKAAQEINSID